MTDAAKSPHIRKFVVHEYKLEWQQGKHQKSKIIMSENLDYR